MKINRVSSCHILCLSSFGGFLKWGYPQIIYFSRSFPFKPAIFGYPHLSYHQIITFHRSILIRETLRWALPELYGRGRGHCQSTPGVPAEDPADLDLQSSHSTCPWGKHPLNLCFTRPQSFLSYMWVGWLGRVLMWCEKGCGDSWWHWTILAQATQLVPTFVFFFPSLPSLIPSAGWWEGGLRRVSSILPSIFFVWDGFGMCLKLSLTLTCKSVMVICDTQPRFYPLLFDNNVDC